MSNVLKGYQPERVWQFFEEYAAIPHGSTNMQQAKEYLIDFAVKRGLSYRSDEADNVIIYKPAAKGYQDAPAIMLQSHMDMVCEKTMDSTHDFLKDGLKLVVEGDILHAKDTTLGGDNGIGLCCMLALLDDNSLKHPSLECIFTTDEEIGLLGAIALDISDSKATCLINIDSSDEDIFTIGCAGGVSYEGTLPVGREKVDGIKYEMTINGLQGGHSGIDIHLNRANATLLMGKVLKKMTALAPRIINLEGGTKDNAINRNCLVNLVIAPQEVANFEELVKVLDGQLKEEWKEYDSGVTLSFRVLGEGSFDVLSKKDQAKMLDIFDNSPHGVLVMSKEIEGFVQTSINFAITNLSGDKLLICYSLRSCDKNDMAQLKKQVEELFSSYGFDYKSYMEYPGWFSNKEAPFIMKLSEAYKECYGKDPVIEAVHAGLECGVFSEKIKDMQAVSIGPNLANLHSPEEKASISSVERFYNYLTKALESIQTSLG